MARGVDPAKNGRGGGCEPLVSKNLRDCDAPDGVFLQYFSDQVTYIWSKH